MQCLFCSYWSQYWKRRKTTFVGCSSGEFIFGQKPYMHSRWQTAKKSFIISNHRSETDTGHYISNIKLYKNTLLVRLYVNTIYIITYVLYRNVGGIRARKELSKSDTPKIQCSFLYNVYQVPYPGSEVPERRKSEEGECWRYKGP